MRTLLFCLAVLLAGPVLPALRGLELIVVPTIQYAHQDLWVRTPPGRSPHSTAVSQVVRQQPVHILVFATGFATGPGQVAEVGYRVTFIRPDGTTGSTTEGLSLIPRQPGLDARHILKATQLVAFLATQEDPLGEWRVLVEATDAVGAVTVRREQRFTVVPDDALAAPLEAGVPPERWFLTYHDRPAPQQLMAAVRLAAETPPPGGKPRRDAENGAWLGFFEQVLEDNPWLVPPVVARLEQARGRERELLATLLAYAMRDHPEFARTLPAGARAAFDTHRQETWPVPSSEPLNGAQLDVLWGRFFASGRYEPLRQLVAVLAYLPHKDALENYKKLAVKPAKPGSEVIRSAVFQAASWSLRSNLQRDQVVRDYCEGILLRKELPEDQHRWLASLWQLAVTGPAQPGAGAKP